MIQNAGALNGTRVIDLTRILAGPWATQTLADLGAEVIKVEHPTTGDDTRSWGPPFTGDNPADSTQLSGYFCTANRNKQSIAIDIADDQGADLLRRMVAESDVFIENFKVGGLEKYGLDYDSLKQINPGLIYCSITGFGQTGPYATRAGYDFIIQAMSGLMSVTGQPDGAPGDEPMKIGVALTDILTGLYSCIGILTALTHRDKTGVGQHIDMSLFDVSVASMANQAMNYLVTGEPPVRLGNAHPNIVPYQVFPTADGHLIIAVGNDRQFVDLCEALGDAELGTNPRYETNQKRVENRESLIPTLTALTTRASTADWINRLKSAGVPCGPINDMHAVFNDPQTIARGSRIDLEGAHATIPGVASPLKLSQTPVHYHSAPPMLGQHTGSVLKEVLKLSDAECQRLYQNGVCYQADSTPEAG